MNDDTLELFQDELEHLDFMDELRRLAEEIAWAIACSKVPFDPKFIWDDIDIYGDEPVFTSLLMDKLELE